MDQSKLVISDEQRYQFNFLAKKPGSNIFQLIKSFRFNVPKHYACTFWIALMQSFMRLFFFWKWRTNSRYFYRRMPLKIGGRDFHKYL